MFKIKYVFLAALLLSAVHTKGEAAGCLVEEGLMAARRLPNVLLQSGLRFPLGLDALPASPKLTRAFSSTPYRFSSPASVSPFLYRNHFSLPHILLSQRFYSLTARRPLLVSQPLFYQGWMAPLAIRYLSTAATSTLSTEPPKELGKEKDKPKQGCQSDVSQHQQSLSNTDQKPASTTVPSSMPRVKKYEQLERDMEKFVTNCCTDALQIHEPLGNAGYIYYAAIDKIKELSKKGESISGNRAMRSMYRSASDIANLTSYLVENKKYTTEEDLQKLKKFYQQVYKVATEVEAQILGYPREKAHLLRITLYDKDLIDE